MDSIIATTLIEIKDKAKLLKQRADRLEKENASLRENVFEQLKIIDTQKEKINQLKQEIIAKTFVQQTGAVNTNLKKEIDTYIHLIDECLANLKTQ